MLQLANTSNVIIYIYIYVYIPWQSAHHHYYYCYCYLHSYMGVIYASRGHSPFKHLD